MLSHSLTQTFEAEWLRIDSLGDAQDVEDNTGSWSVIALSDDHTVTDNDQKFPLIVVLHPCCRIYSPSKRILILRIGWNLADDKLIKILGSILLSELQCSEEFEANHTAEKDRNSQQDVSSEHALGRISCISCTDPEQVRQAGLHPATLSRTQLERCPVLRNITASTDLKQSDHKRIHEVRIGGRGHLLPRCSLKPTSTLDVVCEVVYRTVEDCDRLLFFPCKCADILWSVTNGAFLVSRSEDIHLLPEPIRPRVVRKSSEVVVSVICI